MDSSEGNREAMQGPQETPPAPSAAGVSSDGGDGRLRGRLEKIYDTSVYELLAWNKGRQWIFFTLVDVSEDNRPPSGGGVTLEDAAVKIQVRQKTASIVTIYVQFNHPRPAGKATR